MQDHIPSKAQHNLLTFISEGNFGTVDPLNNLDDDESVELIMDYLPLIKSGIGSVSNFQLLFEIYAYNNNLIQGKVITPDALIMKTFGKNIKYLYDGQLTTFNIKLLVEMNSDSISDLGETKSFEVTDGLRDKIEQEHLMLKWLLDLWKIDKTLTKLSQRDPELLQEIVENYV